ncbi:hypothetical protein B9W68_17090 [Streptomyces sp. CS227]|nr:hypothetical protein B9W68_17090 [Streptomyces sp. CS227]
MRSPRRPGKGVSGSSSGRKSASDGGGSPAGVLDTACLREPEPVPGCAGCRELANMPNRARAGGDTTTVSDCDVFLRRHPDGH